MPKLHTRQAENSDIPALQHLFKTTIEQVCKTDYNAKQIAEWTKTSDRDERWLSALKSQYFIVAEINQTIVGFGSLMAPNYIDFLYVGAQFQRQGIAQLLYDTIVAKAKLGKVETLESDVSITARPFFERQGFKVVHENRIERNGVILTNFKMQKRLIT